MYIIIPILSLVVLLIILFSRGYITIKTRSSSVNERRFLKSKKNKKDIYHKDIKSNIISPFTLEIEPISKLILFDIEDDPIYTTIELQEFNDDISNGLVIILYRRDKEIDVYYTEGIKHNFYKGSKNGSTLLFTPLDYTFEKTEDQLQFLIDFIGKDGNRIFVEAVEKNSNKSHFDILAPAGDMIDNFTSFPLFFMKKTAFFEKNYSTIKIEIGNRKREPVAIPIAINHKFVYLSRYCLDPVAVNLNNNFYTTLSIPTDLKREKYRVILNSNKDRNEIDSLICEKYNHKASLRFSPSIPELLSLKNGTKMKGRFSTSVDGITGIVAGNYLLEKVDGEVKIEMNPEKGWQPMPGKKWFKKYHWISKISTTDKAVSISSQWIL